MIFTETREGSNNS